MALSYYNNFTHLCVNTEEYNQLRKYLKCQKRADSILPSNLTNSILPSNLTNLELKNFHGYLRTLTRGLKKLTSLSLLNKCKITIRPGCIHPTVTHLTWETNQELTAGVLHEGIKVLRIDYYGFGRMVLPSTLKSLYIGRNFNFEFHFNEIYPGLLPDGLEVLSIDCSMCIHDNSLPNTLKKIYFGRHYKQMRLPSKFPESLELFSLDAKMTPDFLLKLPSDLRILMLGQNAKIQKINLDLLPTNLEVFGLNFPINKVKGRIKIELKKIIFGKNFHMSSIYESLFGEMVVYNPFAIDTIINLDLLPTIEIVNLSKHLIYRNKLTNN